ncbi:hypothetical protein DH86_00002376 [Scytalidium sp. 3C]|nr:hypothetical protein DH86_00002376 [Scytalidium sp. 3C]
MTELLYPRRRTQRRKTLFSLKITRISTAPYLPTTESTSNSVKVYISMSMPPL